MGGVWLAQMRHTPLDYLQIHFQLYMFLRVASLFRFEIFAAFSFIEFRGL